MKTTRIFINEHEFNVFTGSDEINYHTVAGYAHRYHITEECSFMHVKYRYNKTEELKKLSLSQSIPLKEDMEFAVRRDFSDCL